MLYEATGPIHLSSSWHWFFFSFPNYLFIECFGLGFYCSLVTHTLSLDSRCWKAVLVVIVSLFFLVMRCVWSSHVCPVGFSLCQRKTKRKEMKILKGKTIFSIYFLVRWFFGSQNCHWFFIGLVIVANFYSSFDCLVNPQSLFKSSLFLSGYLNYLPIEPVIHMCMRTFIFSLFPASFMISIN